RPWPARVLATEPATRARAAHLIGGRRRPRRPRRRILIEPYGRRRAFEPSTATTALDLVGSGPGASGTLPLGAAARLTRQPPTALPAHGAPDQGPGQGSGRGHGSRGRNRSLPAG